MHIETSICGDCGFKNYNWHPLPSCEHYAKFDHCYNRTKPDIILLKDSLCHILALDYKRKQIFKDDSTLIDPNIWGQF